MTLLIILACVFGAVALMVVLGERFGKPMDGEQQAKFSKITWILVFTILLAAIVKEVI
jgi:amino acid permease